MSRKATCDECGSEVLFDAYADLLGNVEIMFETAFCPTCAETGDGEIKYNYTVSEER